MGRPTQRWRRPAYVAVAIVLASGLIAAGWFSASVFTSPAQVDAASRPPSPGAVVATAEMGDLVEQRVLPGSIESKESFLAAVPAASGSQGRSVITSLSTSSGEVLQAGKIVLTVNGSPVFVMQSPFPFYRDLGTGDSGQDVQVLQSNLKQMGLLSDIDGQFGSRTQAAVVKLFRDAGYEAPVRQRAQPEDPTTSPTSAPPEAGPPATLPTPTPTRASEAYLPLSSMMTMPVLPARVDRIPAVGATVGDATVVSASQQSLIIRAALPAGSDGEIRSGARVTVAGSGLDALPGKIEQVRSGASADSDSPPGADPGSQSREAAQPPEAIILLDTPDALSTDLRGKAVTITVEIGVLAQNAVIVPTISVGGGANGTGYILKQTSSGSFERVSVDILASTGGRTAIAADGVSAGDKVKTG